jgi:hypothetical protein
VEGWNVGKMARKKNRKDEQLDYEPTTEQVDYNSVAHQFILAENEEKPKPIVELPAEEQERRELKRRFKKLRGYKPVEKDLTMLRAMVEDAERQARYS